MVLTRSGRLKMTEDTQDLYNLIAEIRSDLGKMATNEKIDEILTAINQKDERIKKLEGNVASLTKTVVLLTQKIDDVEARCRRGNLRIHGIPVPDEAESGEICIEKVKDVLYLLPGGNDIDNCSLSRAHRVGKVKTNEDGVKEQAMIVGFSTWKTRTFVYKNRKSLKDHRVSLDLTGRRVNLRNLANLRIKSYPSIDFCMADINCSLCLRLKNNTYKYFNSEVELDSILRSLVPED